MTCPFHEDPFFCEYADKIDPHSDRIYCDFSPEERRISCPNHPKEEFDIIMMYQLREKTTHELLIIKKNCELISYNLMLKFIESELNRRNERLG